VAHSENFVAVNKKTTLSVDEMAKAVMSFSKAEKIAQPKKRIPKVKHASMSMFLIFFIDLFFKVFDVKHPIDAVSNY
jgi:hypothetical protein